MVLEPHRKKKNDESERRKVLIGTDLLRVESTVNIYLLALLVIGEYSLRHMLA